MLLKFLYIKVIKSEIPSYRFMYGSPLPVGNRESLKNIGYDTTSLKHVICLRNKELLELQDYLIQTDFPNTPEGTELQKLSSELAKNINKSVKESNLNVKLNIGEVIDAISKYKLK